MVTEYFLIFFLASFSLDSPETIYINESFDVSIFSDDSSIYDIKIIIQNENKEIISQIYNDGWKNPRYYIKSSYPEVSLYKIKAISLSENANICLRWRKSGNTKYDETCHNISISQKSSEIDFDINNKQDTEIINLNSPSKEEYISKNEKERIIIFYSTLFTSIIAILFLALRMI